MTRSPFALLTLAALVLTACSDTTAPKSEKPKTASDAPAGVSLARVVSSSGYVGGVATPYPSVACDGGIGGRSIFVYGATVSPATGIISISQQVVGDVFLYRYTTTGWVSVAAVRTQSREMSGGVQIAGMTNRATLPNTSFSRDVYGQPLPAGYYSVKTRMTWMNDAYANGFYAQTGIKWLAYSDAADYKLAGTFGRITAGPGWCYIY
jgi:hypothetical protein